MDQLGLLFVIVLIIAAIEIWRLMRKKRRLSPGAQEDSLPAVYLVQAEDAHQRTHRFVEILENLKNENRIANFTALGIENDLSVVEETIGNEDLVLLVLTDEFQSQKARLEKQCKSLKANQPEIRIAEMIIDNVVYDNEFITLPTDLRPVHNREDMDTAWKDIEQILKDLYSVKTIREQESVGTGKWPEYLKMVPKVLGKAILVYIVLIAVGVALLLLLILALLDESFGDLIEWLFFLTLFAAVVVAIWFTRKSMTRDKNP